MENQNKQQMVLAVFFFLTLMSSHVFAGPGPGFGPGPGTAPGVTETYDTKFRTLHFSGSGICSSCHNNIQDGTGNDVSLQKHWSATLMANSSHDPAWKAKTRSEIARMENINPDLVPLINKKCSRCHAPMANVEAGYEGATISLFDGGFLSTANLYYAPAMDGVSCTLCHQVDPVNLGTPETFSGNYYIEELVVSPPERKIYGQYDNLTGQPMVRQAEFTPVFSPHMSDSAMCGVCHNLKTPYVNIDGDIVSSSETEFPEQMVYSEWEQSIYATNPVVSCQDCHMNRTNQVAISNTPRRLTKRDEFAKHKFAGANALVLNLLNDYQAQLNVNTADFITSRDEALLSLQNAAEIAIESITILDNTLQCSVKITSQTGHKLPSGIPMRRIVLHFAAEKGGQILFESGKIEANGRVIGHDGDQDSALVEQHWDVISSADQAQVYESVMENFEGEITHTLLRAAAFRKDNRLLPLGFDDTVIPADIAVMGAAQNDSNFVGGSDVVTYEIPIDGAGAYSIKAELIYQAFSYNFIDDIRNEIGLTEVNTFMDMYDTSQNKSVVMATAEAQIVR